MAKSFKDRWREGQQRSWARNRRELKIPERSPKPADLKRPHGARQPAQPSASTKSERPAAPRRTRRRAPPLLLLGAITFVAVVAIGLAVPMLRPLLSTPAEAAGEAGPVFSGSATVIDGDTIDVGGRRIRIWGVDAPETDQSCKRADGSAWACGQQSSAELKAFLGARAVSCRQVDTDRYSRAVSRCEVGHQDVGDWLVSNGWAVDFRRYSGNAYDPQERSAKSARKGLWASTFVMPWDWRSTKTASPNSVHQIGATQTAHSSPPRGCMIKGNVNSKGDRIFHSPGQADYDKTVISEGKGERWFCSADEAIKAGWRAAER